MKKRSSFTLCLALLFCLCSFSGCGEAESLSAEELQEIENCLNSAEYNGFINTYFDSLEEIDLTRAFYDGAGAATFDQTGWSEEEKADVLAATGWETYAGAVLKLTGDAVESVLQERLGVSRGQMADKLSEAMRYVEKYDAYYLMHGDTDYAPVTTVAGRRTGDTYEIEYIPESYTPEYATVTLIKTKTGFRFASNKGQSPCIRRKPMRRTYPLMGRRTCSFSGNARRQHSTALPMPVRRRVVGIFKLLALRRSRIRYQMQMPA